MEGFLGSILIQALVNVIQFPIMIFWFPQLFEMKVFSKLSDDEESSDEKSSDEKELPLLILDLNKVLAFRNFIYDDKMILDEDDRETATVLGNHYGWRRPHLEYFLEYVFDHFEVAVWSSANSKNVDLMCDLIFAERKDELLFVWDQTYCEKIKPHPNPNESKPFLFRKDLVRVWNTFREYDETNTIVLDDCPYKMTDNPALNVIFPKPWSYLKEESSADTYLRFEAIVELEHRRVFLENQ